MADFKALVTGESEAQFRQFLTALFTAESTMLARDGVLGSSGLTVRQTTSASGSVTVDAGVAIVQDTVLNGVQPLVNNTTKTLDILGANPMGGIPRNDLVVFDAATGTITSITGTPNATPTDPSVPATALPLARLRHIASATTVPAANIDDLRVFTTTRGGVVIARSQADRDAMGFEDKIVRRTDTGNLEVYNGSTWQVFKPAGANGTRTIGQVGANAFVQWTVTFPTGVFTSAPRVVVTPSSGRLNMAVRNVTTSGCTVEAYNASTVASSATGEFFTWVAVQP